MKYQLLLAGVGLCFNRAYERPAIGFERLSRNREWLVIIQETAMIGGYG